jgi:restriction system protein
VASLLVVPGRQVLDMTQSPTPRQNDNIVQARAWTMLPFKKGTIMARKTNLMTALARDMARAQRQAEADHKRRIRQAEQSVRANERTQAQAERDRRMRQATSERERKQAEKEAREQHLNDRQCETEEFNAELVQKNNALSSVLGHTLGINDAIAFASLRVQEPFPDFLPPQELMLQATPPEIKQYVAQVKPPSFLENTLGMKGRYQKELQAAEAQFAAVLKAHEAAEAERRAKFQELKAEYKANFQAYQQKVAQRDQEVTELEQAYQQGDVSAVIGYNTMVLEQSQYPEDFPQTFRLAYAPDSKELVIEYELPKLDVVPTASEYKYTKSKDAIDEKPRKMAEIKEQYQDVVAAVTLRTIHEVFEADQCDNVQLVAFNGLVNSVDPATGRDIRPIIISARVTKTSFMELNLARIDKLVCLRNLGATVSPRPEELQPVKPVVEFDMVDKRYIEQGDVLSGLDARPNLMDLTPSEFETLVSNMFGKMGLETKLTRASRDGGVDAVAYDTRPILGGKVVIQAKRYRNTVGVSAVRDLYGTMLNEGASKGIIVATSSYGPDAYEFSKDKPMELIDGGGLLYLLDQVGVKAKIILPQD